MLKLDKSINNKTEIDVGYVLLIMGFVKHAKAEVSNACFPQSVVHA